MSGNAGIPGWQFWIDRGGTFTDVVARSPEGELSALKLLSEDPGRYPDAAIEGIRRALRVGTGDEIPVSDIAAVKMGTTVATNALLERTGEPTLLVTNRGFADALRIGYQNRPRLFALHIELPEQVYCRVAEIPGRMDARGNELEPLDEGLAREALAAAFGDGIRSVAIVFMHGYRYPDHEARVTGLAREAGFTQISASHQVSPLMKFVSRGDTTAVDAYLSPILRRYVDRVSAALPGVRTMFMQSNGGLTDASLFQGKDSILSGPAGGVVGAVATAGMAGFEKIIGFDMGGTSTDVSHFAGAFERSFETVVAGVRMRVPMMSIHTVAAGGGSILRFDGARFRVGPESAGANPGPACYGKGGPLTVTDANLLLGRLQARHFPEIFGPGGNGPLDTDIVRKKFEMLAGEIGTATGRQLGPEETAEGFLTIAVENMANAIKKISVQRGYDVTEYTLNCFGGAGGQHACGVADALGIERIQIHPLAGVLSAYGMGLAEVRALRALAVEEELSERTAGRLVAAVRPLVREAVAELAGQGIAEENIQTSITAALRYTGTDTALEVPLAGFSELRGAFDALHRRQFGFVDGGRPLIIEAVRVEAAGAEERITEHAAASGAAAGAPDALENVAVFTGGRARDVPLFARETLAAGQKIEGPAIIVEENATTVVEPGWSLDVNRFGHLILHRASPREAGAAVGTDADPVMLELFNNLFMSIAEQMGAVLANTATSVNIKERFDFSCALFDAAGGLVANAPHLPVHLGSMGESVATIIRARNGAMKPGDVYVLNAPYNGGTHLPDITVVTPVFDEAGPEILFYVASRGHHADIGGTTPGSMPPDSRSVDEEGVLIDNFQLVAGGRFLEREARELLESGAYPSRNPDQNIADFRAQIAANERGAAEIRSMIGHFGIKVVQAYMRHVKDNAAEAVRRVLDRLPDGDFARNLDNGGTIKVAISVDRSRRRATVDFTGTSSQSETNFNAPSAVCRAAVLYVFRCLVDDDIPLNDGCLDPIDLVIPEGSLLSPRYPAAVVAGNVETSQRITDVLFGAARAMASAQSTMNNFTFGDERYQYYETICGGAGAGPDFDGASAVHTHMTNTRLTDPEVLEWRFPVILERFSLRPGSGGAGRHWGGDGVIRKIRFLEPMTAAILSGSRTVQPFGLAGGSPGEAGRNYVERASGRIDELGPCDSTEMRPGDVFVIETPGGGGYGFIG